MNGRHMRKVRFLPACTNLLYISYSDLCEISVHGPPAGIPSVYGP
jgi:hypothetical protein